MSRRVSDAPLKEADKGFKDSMDRFNTLNKKLRNIEGAENFDEFDESTYDAFTYVKTQEELEQAKATMEEARARLFQTSADFNKRMEGNWARAHERASQARNTPSVGGYSMPHGATFSGQVATVMPYRRDKERVWGCPECGSTNVNWKSFRGKRQAKAAAKRYGMDYGEIKKHGVRFCIMCTQRMGRDILLKKLFLDDLDTIKKEFHEKKVDGTLFKKAKKKSRKS